MPVDLVHVDHAKDIYILSLAALSYLDCVVMTADDAAKDVFATKSMKGLSMCQIRRFTFEDSNVVLRERNATERGEGGRGLSGSSTLST